MYSRESKSIPKKKKKKNKYFVIEKAVSHKIAVFSMRHTVGLKQKFELQYLHVKTLVSYIGMGFIYKLVAMLFLTANHSSMTTSAIELVFENSVVC